MNPSALATFASRAAVVGEAIWPATVTIAGEDYPAECPRPAREKVGLEPGYEEVLDARVVRIRKTELATPPALNSYLTMDETEWQIRAISGENLTTATWTLSLEKKK